MSNSARLEWHDQEVALNQRLKGFLANPGNEQMNALLADMQAYAEAARTGAIEIPKRWTSYS